MNPSTIPQSQNSCQSGGSFQLPKNAILAKSIGQAHKTSVWQLKVGGASCSPWSVSKAKPADQAPRALVQKNHQFISCPSNCKGELEAPPTLANRFDRTLSGFSRGVFLSAFSPFRFAFFAVISFFGLNINTHAQTTTPSSSPVAGIGGAKVTAELGFGFSNTFSFKEEKWSGWKKSGYIRAYAEWKIGFSYNRKEFRFNLSEDGGDVDVF